MNRSRIDSQPILKKLIRCTSSRTVFKGKCVAFCAQVQFPAFASGGKPSVWLKGMMQQFTGSDRFACGGAEFWLAFATIDTKEH
jgi:hypothetical protein